MCPFPRKEICDCGVLEKASKEPEHPIRWDEEMNEYYIAVGNSGHMMIYYCPFCGGRTPESRRSSPFAHVSEEEAFRIYQLFGGLRTVSDIKARFGLPDEEQETGCAVEHPESQGEPGYGTVFRTMIYKDLSPVADVVFEIGMNDSVYGKWVQKYIGDIRT